MKLFVLVVVPPGVVTLSGPVVVPVKFVPLIVTLVLTVPLVGVKRVIVVAHHRERGGASRRAPGRGHAQRPRRSARRRRILNRRV